MSSSSSSNTAQSVAQVTPTQKLVTEVIEKIKLIEALINSLLRMVEMTNMKIDALGEEMEDGEGGQDEYDMQMEEPTTPKRMKYTPKYEKK